MVIFGLAGHFFKAEFASSEGMGNPYCSELA